MRASCAASVSRKWQRFPRSERAVFQTTSRCTRMSSTRASRCDGLVVEGNGLEAECGGVLQPQAGVFEQPRVCLVLLREHEVRPAVGLPDRRVPRGVQDRRPAPSRASRRDADPDPSGRSGRSCPRETPRRTAPRIPRLGSRAARLRVHRAPRFPGAAYRATRRAISSTPATWPRSRKTWTAQSRSTPLRRPRPPFPSSRPSGS